MASRIYLFDYTFTNGESTSFLYYNPTRSAANSPHTTQYFNVDNVIHNNLIGMNSATDASGSFVGNRYYSQTKADLSNFNELLISASKTTSNSHIIYISLIGNTTDSNVLLNTVDQVKYPIIYPIPVNFIGFMGVNSAQDSYNPNYTSGIATVKYYYASGSNGNYHIKYNSSTYDYTTSDAWHNDSISLPEGDRYTHYLCTSITLKQNYYVWDASDSVSFDVVLYVFTNLANSSTGFPWQSASIRYLGTTVPNATGWKCKEFVIKSGTINSSSNVTISTSEIASKINASSPALMSGVNVYFAHGKYDSLATTKKFEFVPSNWGNFINNGTGALTNYISSIACTSNEHTMIPYNIVFSHDDINLTSKETWHMPNIPVVIKGTKQQETGSGGSNPVFYSIGFIGLRNVIYNIGISSTQHWYAPLPNDAITYYKYLCLEEHRSSAYQNNIVTNTNSYFMINSNTQNVYVANSSNHAYVNAPNASQRDFVILTSYSGSIYPGGGSGSGGSGSGYSYGSGGGY